MNFLNNWSVDRPIDPGMIFDSCSSINLGDGILIALDHPQLSFYGKDISFHSHCDGQYPAYIISKAKKLMLLPYVDSIENDWDRYVKMSGPDGGKFKFSIYVMVFIITGSFVANVFLTICLFVAIHDKPRNFMLNIVRLASLLALTAITMFLIRMLLILNFQFTDLGSISVNYIINTFGERLDFKILDFISIFLLQICQLFNITRFFTRIQERRLVFLSGIVLVIISNILYAVSLFSLKHEPLFILSPFVYLLRIALSTCYATIIISFVISRRDICFDNLSLGFLSILSCLLVSFQVAFFFFDITKIWLYNISEIFNLTGYVASTAVIWEWINRVFVIQRKREAQSILGRPIYAEETGDNKFGRYALRIQDALMRPISTDDSSIRQPNEDNDDESGSTILQAVAETILNKTSSKNTAYKESAYKYDKDMGTEEYDQSSLIQESYELNTKNSTLDHMNQSSNVKPISTGDFIGNKMRSSYNKMRSSYNKMIMFTDYILLNGFGQSSMGSSSENDKNMEARKKNVRERIGLERTGNVHLYQTTNIVFDSDDEHSIEN